MQVVLACHIAAGLTCVVTGALAMTAAKRPGRHTAAGAVYVWSLAVVAGEAGDTARALLVLDDAYTSARMIAAYPPRGVDARAWARTAAAVSCHSESCPSGASSAWR